MAPALAPAAAAPRRLVRTFWRMVGPSQRPMTCALYRTPISLELVASYDLEGVCVRTTHVVSEEAAAIVAAKWKAATVAVGSFVDVDAEAVGEFPGYRHSE